MSFLENAKFIAKNVGRWIYHNRADIAFYGGLVGSAVGTGLLVKGAMDSKPALDEYADKKKQITEATDLTDEDKKKLSKENTINTVKVVGKNTVVGVVVKAASVGAEIYGHNTLHTELDGATALANGLAASIAILHERIAADQGEDKWREYAYGQNFEKIDNVDFETGEVTESVNMTEEGPTIDDFSRWFIQGNSGQWDGGRGYNKKTLCLIKFCWNNRLRIHKDKIFLRDVWQSVFGNLNGFKPEWANAGWLYEDLDGSTMSIEFWPENVHEMDSDTLAFWKEEKPDVKVVFNCYPDVYYIEKLKKQRNKAK